MVSIKKHLAKIAGMFQINFALHTAMSGVQCSSQYRHQYAVTAITPCVQKSDDKITITELIRINYPINLVNWYFFGMNGAILNKIFQEIFEVQIF